MRTKIPALPISTGTETRGRSYIDLDELAESSKHNKDRQSESGGMVGSSHNLSAVLDQIRTVAPTRATVLIEGETGTGKELTASAIHNQSDRRTGPFVKLNCAAMPAGLLESDLFGHERGAFTGAVAQKPGRFEAANGGTLFLDEVGDIPLELQPKLLRVLQEQEFERLGSSFTRRVDVRVVAATNQDLTGLVAKKQFRMDLYYRLNVFPITLPPLRRRVEDIPMLVAHFVHKFAGRMAKQISKIPEDAMESLVQYPWPGNIRELQNVIERSVIVSSGDVFSLDESWPSKEWFQSASRIQEPGPSEDDSRKEREIIEAALAESKGRVSGPSGAAAKLRIPPTTLESRIKALKIRKIQFKFG